MVIYDTNRKGQLIELTPIIYMAKEKNFIALWHFRKFDWAPNFPDINDFYDTVWPEYGSPISEMGLLGQRKYNKNPVMNENTPMNSTFTLQIITFHDFK